MDTDVEPEEQELDAHELAKQDPDYSAPKEQAGNDSAKNGGSQSSDIKKAEPSKGYIDKGITAAEKHANSGGAPGVADKLKGSFLKRNKTKLILGGIGGGIGIGALVAFFFFFLLFKNVHIQKLFFDYRMTQVNRALNARLKDAIQEAKNPTDPAAEPAGDANTPAPDEATATPEQEMAALNPDDVNTLSTATPEEFNAAATDVSNTLQSIESDGAVVDSDLNIERNIDNPTTNDEAEANKKVETELDKETGIGDAPETLKDTVEEAKKLQDGGLDAETAATQALEKTAASGGSLFAETVEAAQGPLLYGTFYCIFKDIYDSVNGALAKLLANGAANTAATIAKTADCQKLGSCSATTIGALAQKTDNSTQSFTQSCGYARAAGGDTTNCKELDVSYIVGRLPVPDSVKDVQGLVDKVLDPPGVNGVVSAGCRVVLSKSGQVIMAGVGVLAIIVSGGTFSLADLGQTVGIVFAGAAGKALALHLVMDYGGGLFKNIGPTLFGNLMDMGSKVIASDTCRVSGCQQLNAQQLQTEQDAYRQEKIAYANQKGFFYKFLSPDNTDSVTVRVALNTPSNPTSMMARTGQMMATLFSPQKLASLFSTNWLATISPVYALTAEDPNLYGIPSYGMPNVNQWGVLENSKWIRDNGGADSFKSKYGKCFSEPLTDAIKDADCKSNDPGFLHYSQYVFDVHLLHNTVLRYNNQTGITSATTATAPPTPGTVDTAALYQPSDSVPCANGTGDAGVVTGHHDGQAVQIRLCTLPNLGSTGSESTPGSQYPVAGANGRALVNSRASDAFFAMVSAAKAAGIPLGSSSTYRTFAHQQDLCNANANCRSGKHDEVAAPGFSNHEMGLAIDFTCNNATVRKTDQCYAWLKQNSTSYGIQPYAAEDWHWSVSGN